MRGGRPCDNLKELFFPQVLNCVHAIGLSSQCQAVILLTMCPVRFSRYFSSPFLRDRCTITIAAVSETGRQMKKTSYPLKDRTRGPPNVWNSPYPQPLTLSTLILSMQRESAEYFRESGRAGMRAGKWHVGSGISLSAAFRFLQDLGCGSNMLILFACTPVKVFFIGTSPVGPE